MSRWASLAVSWRVGWALIGYAAVGLTLAILPIDTRLPQLSGVEDVRAPWSIVASFIVAEATLLTLPEPVSDLPLTSPRQLAWWRAARLLALCAIGCVPLVVSDPAHALSAVMAVLALVGEGMLTAAFVGVRIAWFTPAAHCLAAFSTGAVTSEQFYGWAWIMDAELGLHGAVASLILMTSGLLVWSRKDRW